MGDEARCHARLGPDRSEGKALLEHDRLLFRGRFRLDLPLAGLKVLAEDGALHLAWAEGSAVLELGPQAARWADKIQHPKSLAEKLGLKPGQRIASHGITDPGLRAELAGRLIETPDARDLDALFVVIELAPDLAQLQHHIDRLAPAGALWTIRRKGPSGVGESVVRDAARAAGLTDIKVARVSEHLTAEKFVRPRDRR